MEAPNIDRGKAYRGPTGASFPSRLLTAEERDARQRPRGKVSLLVDPQQPREVEPLRRLLTLDGCPRPVASWVRLVARHEAYWEVYRQVVQPVDRRGRRSQRVRTVFYVRVRLSAHRMLLRSWVSANKEGDWTTGKTVLLARWRGRMVPDKIMPVKEANAIIVTGVV